MNNQYVTPAGYKKWSVGLMIAGLLTLILGFIFLNPLGWAHGDNVNSTRFWAVLASKQFILVIACECSNIFYRHLYLGNGWLAGSFSQSF